MNNPGSIDINALIKKTKQLIENDKSISNSLKATIEILLMVVSLLSNQLGLNSNNSSKPPSSDPNRKKTLKKSGKKPGGQKGHKGETLKKNPNPDRIEKLKVDISKLPKEHYKSVDYESRQVIEIVLSKEITEYQAEIVEDSKGNRYIAEFPKGVTRPVQYGNSVKANSVYMSQYQLIPYKRVEENFKDQVNLNLSCGSVYNFNREAFKRLEQFECLIKKKLTSSEVCHVDETGINVGGKRFWLHCVSTKNYTCYFPHQKRGMDAIDDMGILPNFEGILCHDHWKPYFRLTCDHSLCNAHHLRELERAWEQDHFQWAKDMSGLLLEINLAVDKAGGKLTEKKANKYLKQYRQILGQGQIKCPPPDESERINKRGRIKRSKSRNLLERLIDYEKETLLFMYEKTVPFTNNLGENDIRMTKVQQKISGCFRSMPGAYIFCRIRSYLSTCKKNNISATKALRMLFDTDRYPEFLYTSD